MRRLMKFLHTIGAIGLMGAMACLIVLLGFVPQPSSLTEYALTTAALSGVVTWVFFPSLALTLIAGLLAIALNPAYHSAGWAWAKLATGIVIFEWGFTAILGPIQEEAELERPRPDRGQQRRGVGAITDVRAQLTLGVAGGGCSKCCAGRMAAAADEAS